MKIFKEKKVGGKLSLDKKIVTIQQKIVTKHQCTREAPRRESPKGEGVLTEDLLYKTGEGSWFRL